MSELSSKEVSRSFSDVVNRARYGGERTIVTCRGKPAAVIVPFADLARLEGAACANVSPPPRADTNSEA